MTLLKYSLKKLGKTFRLPKELLKTEMNHDEIAENNWRDEKDIWLSYVKNDVILYCLLIQSILYCYARNNWIFNEGLFVSAGLRVEMF